MEMKSLTIGGKAYDSFASQGAPMDMTSKYTASGASSIEEWAALAKSGSTTEYEVPQGRYYILNGYASLVTIIDWISSYPIRSRSIKIETYADDGFVYFDVFYTNNPGGTVFHFLEFSTEKNILATGIDNFKINYLLPYCRSSDNGKILSVVNGAWGKSELPISLKNPNALTFTGAVTGSYDGSEALTINIPESSPSGTSGSEGLKKMGAVSGYIGIPMADLPQDGTIWMCISSGVNAELYSGTITIEGGSLAANNLITVSSGSAIQLKQAVIVSAGFAIYGMSAADYVGVWQKADA